MDSSLLNGTVNTQELSGFLKYASAIPKYLTEQITIFLKNQGFNLITEGWSRILLYTISLSLVFISFKITKPLIKYILITLAIVLIFGLWIPF